MEFQVIDAYRHVTEPSDLWDRYLEPKFKGRPNRLRGRTFGHPDYFPIYEVASKLEVPVCVHEGARTVMAQAGSDRYSPFGRHVACHPLEQMLAALTFAADGVLERFPELKVAQLEAGCGWIPYWLERMDEHWKHYTLGRERTTKELPSTYWKRLMRRQLRSRRRAYRLLRRARRRRLSCYG